MKRSLLDEALRRARREIESHPQKDNFLHWTFLVKNNRIISDGVNKHHEPPKCFGYHNQCNKGMSGFRPKWRSELDAIWRCRVNLRDCVAINVRLNRGGE